MCRTNFWASRSTKDRKFVLRKITPHFKWSMNLAFLEIGAYYHLAAHLY